MSEHPSRTGDVLPDGAEVRDTGRNPDPDDPDDEITITTI
jgi:hypothetical protein